MSINFIKMHGCGNDFLVIDNRQAKIELSKSQIVKLSDYKKSIGFDQLLLMEESSAADIAIKIYNQDGSQALACGNGSRCIAKLILAETGKSNITIATVDRVIEAKWQDDLISVDMGQAKLIHNNVSFAHLVGSYVEIGNDHAVIRLDNLGELNISEYGPLVVQNQKFSDRLNVNFVQVIKPDLIYLQTFEHGVGATLACGSGACASFYALYKNNLVNDEATINQPGGKVQVSIKDEQIILTGDAEINYYGTIDFKNLIF